MLTCYDLVFSFCLYSLHQIYLSISTKWLSTTLFPWYCYLKTILEILFLKPFNIYK